MDGTGLLASLSRTMSGNRVLRYDVAWSVLAEGSAVDPGEIRLFYTRRVIPAVNRASGDDQAENDYWNREHVWPQSYGPKDNNARTDVHNLVPVDVAQIAFYVDLRCEGVSSGGVPDLGLADMVDEEAARFGRLSTLMCWHCSDSSVC